MLPFASETINNNSSSSSLVDSKLLIREALELRDYQVEIARKCIGNNYLVSIPTGLGKTIIAILVASSYLQNHPHCKIVMIAPINP